MKTTEPDKPVRRHVTIRRAVIAVSLLALLSLTTPCRAVIVFKKGDDTPIRGFIVEENSVHIVVNEPLPNGEMRKWILPRVQIEDIIRAVSTNELTALRPDNPAAYRQYAEDLAAKTEDPEARSVAIRLFLIAAHLSPDDLGRSCLLGAASLARTPEEERALRAMAFVLDPDRDATLLKPPKLVAADFSSIRAEDRAALLRAVRALRRGRAAEARRMLSRQTLQNTIAYYSHIAAQQDYDAALEAGGRLSNKLLQKFITLEITLSDPSASAGKTDKKQVIPWSQVLARRQTKPVKPLALEAITEFDPRECHFMEGKWVATVREE